MLNDKNSYNYGNRNLSDVFRELQSMQNNSNIGQTQYNINPQINIKRSVQNPKDINLSHLIVGCSILAVSLAIFFPKNYSFNSSYAKSNSSTTSSEYEVNRHRLNMQNIISGNIGATQIKEHAIEERDVEFEITYNNNSSLPKGEEIIIQEGILGKDRVTVIKSYENGDFVEEIIISKEKIADFTPKIIDLGTSEFLAKHKVHIGDMMYLTQNCVIKETVDENSKDIAEIKKYLDVKLLELPNEDWCKVSFDGVEGFLKTSNLTSSYTTPNVVEKNRIQRILLKVNIDMELNKSSGITLNDYKKIFTNLPEDTRNIFEDNYQVFYNAEKKYNINGIFLASIAIHESSWGSSQISQDKNNLFGYGSYDNTPYESSFEFDSYAEGIETVAKSLVKYYLNPVGTKIYDEETAAGWYFNGPTLIGVNTRYASDKEWYTKVYNYMVLLYNRL